MSERMLHAIFCDDVREEIGGKRSYIGVYGPELIVQNAPGVLPKLCIVVSAATPVQRPFERLVFRVLRDDEPMVETTVPDDALKAASALPNTADRNGFAVLVGVFQMSPFVIDRPMILRIRAETEDETLKGLALKVVIRDPAAGELSNAAPEPLAAQNQST
jgi:hypothetical protein